MGIRWRRLNERVRQTPKCETHKLWQFKQKLQLDNGTFLATSNRRCEMMFEEAAQFAVHLKRMETNIKKLQQNAEGIPADGSTVSHFCVGVDMMVDTRNVMLCSLPCVFDFSPSGQAVPEDPEPQMIGKDVRLDRFAVAMQTVRQKMEEDVMEPLQSWLEAFNNAVVQSELPVDFWEDS